ncbi:threonine ammonia-lyase [Terasakiella pusilla]|uniref:threonine ammonia-lyase n=1 Tax=Terasakiella pusilla TaxID=64973 RepID=UPI003AA85A9C
MLNFDLPVFDDILNAAEQIKGTANLTPLIESSDLNERVEGRVLLKVETLQRTGSFKFRGAYNRISRLDTKQYPGGIIAYSGGNHAQGAAASASLMQIPSMIMMPTNAVASKVEATRALGATVAFYPPDEADSRDERAQKIARKTGAVVVPSYDDPHVIAGQGTVGLEIFEAANDSGLSIDSLLVPCSGGGLAAGCSLAKDALSPNCKLYTVEPEGFDDTARSLRLGERVKNHPGAKSICDALLMSPPGELTYAINRNSVATGISVNDHDVRNAMIYAFYKLRLVLEPGGAVALAAILGGKLPTKNFTTALVLSGGNVDPDLFRSIVLDGVGTGNLLP